MVADIAHGKLAMPVLALGGSASNGELVALGAALFATDVHGGVLPDCGHFLAEECPRALLDQLLPFLARPTGTLDSRSMQKKN